MKMGKAMEIVLELARQNAADAEQQLALDTVEDWVCNNLEDDD